eukprot:364698-Chlamydomonas_euryale.AAC.6
MPSFPWQFSPPPSFDPLAIRAGHERSGCMQCHSATHASSAGHHRSRCMTCRRVAPPTLPSPPSLSACH